MDRVKKRDWSSFCCETEGKIKKKNAAEILGIFFIISNLVMLYEPVKHNYYLLFSFQ